MASLKSPRGITTKIFAIAASILILLLAIAINTHAKIRIINEEVKALSESILPIATRIDHAIIATLEQEIHFERALRYIVKDQPQERQISAEIQVFQDQGRIAQQHFEHATEKLNTLANDHSHLIEEEVLLALRRIQKHAEQFHNDALAMLLEMQSSVDNSDALYGDALHVYLQQKDIIVSQQQEQLNKESESVLQLLQNFAIATSEQAKQHQEGILIQNSVLSLLAVIFGLLYSGLVSRKLSKPLVALNEQVSEALEQHQLETIQISGKDEVAKLTEQFNVALKNLQRSEKLKDMFGQYLDPRLISHIETGEETFKLDGEKQSVTVLFTSLDNLSWDKQHIAPQEMITIINQYLKLQMEDIGYFKGVVNFTHTDILTFWCHPFSEDQHHTHQACDSVLSQINKTCQFQRFLHKHYPEFRDVHGITLRAGLTKGELVVANMGPSGARAFTVIGDEVNGASRLNGVARFFDVNAVLSRDMVESLSDDYVTRPLGWVKVPGKDEAIDVMQLMGKRQHLENHILSAIDSYHAAFEAFQSGHYLEAQNDFSSYDQQVKGDLVSQRFMAECQTFMEQTPDANAQHFWVITQK